MLIERRTATDQALIEAPEAGIGHAAVNGAIMGFVVVLTIVSGIALAAGAGLVSALGVGAFVALWGGPGWGGMVGAVRYADRIADDERSAAHRRAEEAPQRRPVLDVSPASRPIARPSKERTNVGPASENSLSLVSRLVLAPNGKIFYSEVGQMWGHHI